MVWMETKKGIFEGLAPARIRLPKEIDVSISLSNLPVGTRTTHRFHTWVQRPELKDIFTQIRYFTLLTKHHFLTMAGPPGVGKTHIAMAILWDWLEHGYGNGCYWTTSALLDHLRGCYDRQKNEEQYSIDHQLNWLKKCGLLVMDDIGAHKGTEWADDKLQEIVDYRYLNTKLTILTTNVKSSELPPRISDRMMEGQVVTLMAPSYRPIKAKERSSTT